MAADLKVFSLGTGLRFSRGVCFNAVSKSLVVQGRAVSELDLELIRHWVGQNPGWSRWRLSRELAARWDWRNGVGQLKDMAARTLLVKLQQRGLIELPARRQAPTNRMRCAPPRPCAGEQAPIRGMMMDSREAFVNYTMPLGLHHLIGGDHYAPQPWNNRAPRADWTATYYHKASEEGIGFDRTKRGDRAVEQYFPPVCEMFDDIKRCPEKYLLWFHRCAWDYRMKSGKTLWEELCARYQGGAEQAAALRKAWQTLAGKIDARRHREVADRLSIQVTDSAKWRDQILEYFGRYSKKAIPGSI